MRTFLLAAALLSAAIPGAAPAQEPDSLRDVGFGEFTTGRFARDLPVGFRIPVGYVSISPPERATRTYWTSPADSIAQAADPQHDMRDGFYSVSLSMNVGYDADADRFFGDGSDETTLSGDFEQQGFTRVSLERHRINGYPVLFVEAEKDDRRVMIVYVAALVDTNVVFAFYSHPSPIRDVDLARWAAFKAAILASPPPAAPAR
ncbi:MAG TPA: hypothetical protein VF142_15350 [Longimicrobium sp.]